MGDACGETTDDVDAADVHGDGDRSRYDDLHSPGAGGGSLLGDAYIPSLHGELSSAAFDDIGLTMSLKAGDATLPSHSDDDRSSDVGVSTSTSMVCFVGEIVIVVTAVDVVVTAD